MSGNTDLDAMIVDDLDGYGSTLAQMGGEDGYSLFPKSDYQGDGSHHVHMRHTHTRTERQEQREGEREREREWERERESFIEREDVRGYSHRLSLISVVPRL
jgi:hypothetical protein